MLEYTTDRWDGPAPEVKESLDELAREGARRMIEAALQLEVAEHIEELRGERGEHGHALVVRNGKARERRVTLGAGTVKLRAPRVNDRRPEHRFTSKILPPCMRRSPAVNEALPALCLRGLSTGDSSEDLAALVGPEGAALSPATITQSLRIWHDEKLGVSVRWSAKTMSESGPMGCTSRYAWKKIAWLAW